MTLLVAGLVLFFATHLLRVVAPEFRERMVARWGRLRWQAVYAVLALVGFLMLVSGYGSVRWTSPLLWGPPPAWTKMLAGLVMAPALVLLVAAYLPGRIRATVRHPMMIATLAWAATHLLAKSRVADLLLFGGFLAWALVVTVASFRRPWTRPKRSPSLLWDGAAAATGLALWWWLVFAGGHLRLFGMPAM
jgi:uncharacterized membrane protein